MRRPSISAALLAGLLAVAATAGQPPAGAVPVEKKVEKKVDPTDAAVAAALANDADVKIARAKLQLAEAEVSKAKQAVVIKVLTLKATIQDRRAALETAKVQFDVTERAFNAARVSQQEMLIARAAYERVQGELARVETELKLITGDGQSVEFSAIPNPKSVADDLTRALLTLETNAHDELVRRRMAAFQALMSQARDSVAVKGPIPEQLRRALDKPVRLGKKGEDVSFAKALEVFKKEAGLDVPVRPLPAPLPAITSDGEELPIVAWFQLYQDTAAAHNDGVAFYVREYGILVGNKHTAPPDAPTLTEFWKQNPVPGAKKEPAPEPKSK